MPRGIKNKPKKSASKPQALRTIVESHLAESLSAKRIIREDARSIVLNNLCKTLSDSIENICAAVVQTTAITDESIVN